MKPALSIPSLILKTHGRILFIVLTLSLSLLMAVSQTASSVLADSPSASELQALYEYPNWVGNDSSSGTTTCSSVSTPVVDPNTSTSGSISSGVGKGMSASAQKLFQQYIVGGAAKNNVDPNLLATFYYTEMSRTNDSTNNANADANPPVTGDGDWEEPAPPVGNGPAYITNSKGYGLYGLNASDYQEYGEDGDGDGNVTPGDLADAIFTSAAYLKGHGFTGTASPAIAFSAGEAYNPDPSTNQAYAHSVENTYAYLTGQSVTTVTSVLGSSCPDAGSTDTTAAPGSVQAAVNAAKELSDAKIPYSQSCRTLTKTPPSCGYDCSASTSWVLLTAGFTLPGNATWGSWAPVSGDYTNWGVAGPGQEMTIWADGGDHVFIEFNVPGLGHYQMNTSYYNGANGLPDGSGPQFFPWGQNGETDAASGNFVARHWPGT